MKDANKPLSIALQYGQIENTFKILQNANIFRAIVGIGDYKAPYTVK